MYNFLDSNFFQTLIMFLVGLFIFWVYIWQKHDELKKATQIILNEIRSAENIINEINDKKIIISKLSPIMPISSWSKFNHLFIGKLIVDEYNLINDFYIKCEEAEKSKDFFYRIVDENISAKASYMQEKIIDCIYENIIDNNFDITNYEKKKGLLIEQSHKESYAFYPDAPRLELVDYVSKITLVTSTNVGNLLKKLADYK